MLSKIVRRAVSRVRSLHTAPTRAVHLAHGPNGTLTELLVPRDSKEFSQLLHRSMALPELVLNKRQLCDLELLLNGGFSPLKGFMNKGDYDAVVQHMRLRDNTLFPMPITLDVPDQKLQEIKERFGASGTPQLALRDEEGNTLAIMDVEEVWKPNKQAEAELVFGGDPEHPAVVDLNTNTHNTYVGGKLHGLQLPPHYDYLAMRHTPRELRDIFTNQDWNHVVAFQTRNPLHRAHFELTLKALEDDGAKLLLHPVVGKTKPGDIDHHTRVKCYREIMPKYPAGRAMLSVLPLAMRMAGPREAVWHAIIRKNYGATHFILGRDHAGPGSNSKGKDFYGPYDARDFALKFESELGMKLLAFDAMSYVPEHNKYYAVGQIPAGLQGKALSGTEVRKRLRTGEHIPEWFSFPEVVKILRVAHPPRFKQGFCVFFTGLSGSGKTTIANALVERLMELDTRSVCVLDGDHVRRMLSSELGFSLEHRNLNVRRIGYVASQVVKPGGVAITALISPYRQAREEARKIVSENGAFIEVFLSTSVDVCEKRDRKGLYRKAREGKLKNFTGIDDPYEPPEKPEVVIDTNKLHVSEAVEQIIKYLTDQGFLLAPGAAAPTL